MREPGIRLACAHGLHRAARTIEPSAEAEAAWVAKIADKSTLAEDFLESCTPGYYNDEGRVRERSRRNAWYGSGSPEFFRIIAGWRETGSLPGMDVTWETPQRAPA